MNARNRTRSAAGLTACTALAAALAVLAAPASAAQDDVIGLSWDGEGFAAETTESFLGVPVTVPGDSTERTLTVRNDGPTSGTLTATIENVELLEPASGFEDSFYDDVTVEWADDGGAALAQLDADGETRIGEFDLDVGETATITVGYAFPVEATSGNTSEVGDRSASFNVVFALGGDELGDPPLPPAEPPVTPTDADDTSDAPAETPEEAEPPSPLPVDDASTDGTPSAAQAESGADGLAETGGSPAAWLALAGAVLIPLGVLLRVRRRGRPRPLR